MTQHASILQTSAYLPASLEPQFESLKQKLLAGLNPDQLGIFDQPEFAQSAAKVCICSEFVRDSWLRYPEMLTDLVHSGDLFSAEYSDRFLPYLQTLRFENEADLAKQLRLYRRREMVRIAWRDLAGWADLNETLGDLTALAEACIETALSFFYQQASQRWGTPTLADGRPFNLVVLGMGKLGAWELNYSSDIDLIFAYAEDGLLSSKKEISYGEFFTRICRSLVKALDEITVDGFVFRTDVRLRPFGDSGPLIMTFDGMENYYLTQAREWERYAMIKARQVAGDFNSGRHLAALIKPFVYRRYLDYGAFEELRSLKFQITQELKRKDRMENIKLGPGGIREVEFIGQAFQLIRGGQEPALQQREIQVILATLAELKLMSAEEVACLQFAYRFLRRAENHIQQYQDRQTHDLPTDAKAQAILAYSMDFADWPSFKAELDQIRTQVHSLFEQVFSLRNPNDSQQNAELIWAGDEQALERLSELGFAEADSINSLLQDFKRSHACRRLSAKGAKSLDRLLPQLINALATAEQPAISLSRMLGLFEAVAGRSVYLALLAENPQALTQLIALSAASPWICDYLAQYPILFDELLDSRSLFQPLAKQALSVDLNRELAKIEIADSEQLMIALRQFKHLNVLRVAAADIMGMIPIMVVSDYLTWIAETILTAVLHRSWLMLAEKHGCPAGFSSENPGFAIVAFGKFGGIELGYGSDLDLVFIYDGSHNQSNTDGVKSISASQFYLRLAQKIRLILDTKMLSGILYEADLRLRPNGESGLLVSDIHHYEAYYTSNAWTWEHQALVRARFITGDLKLKQQFEAIRQRVLALPRDLDQLKTEVREMREKMRDNLDKSGANGFDLKQSSGGIADIEFLVQFGILACSAKQPLISTYTDNVRLLAALQEAGFICAEDAGLLKQAYCAYRDYGHHQVLQEQKAIADSLEFSQLRSQVQRIWQTFMT